MKRGSQQELLKYVFLLLSLLICKFCSVQFVHSITCSSDCNQRYVNPCLRTFMEINIVNNYKYKHLFKYLTIYSEKKNKYFTKCNNLSFRNVSYVHITKIQTFFILHHHKTSQKKLNNELKLVNQSKRRRYPNNYSSLDSKHLNIQLGWIKDFDKFVVNLLLSSFASTFFMFDTFRSSSKLINTFSGHTSIVRSIDYSIFDDCQFICSGSNDKTVRVWDVDNNKQIQSFNGHSSCVYCVKFSSYYYHNHRQNIICSSSGDKTICFWDFKNNKQLQIFNEHTDGVCSIEFSPFNGGRYLCSGSFDKTIHLWDVETSKSLNLFNGHKDAVWCVDISPLQSNNKDDKKNNKMNNIGVIGGNGYTICSGSWDTTIRIWDIETAKQINVFKGHNHWIRSVKYGLNELLNTILSGSLDESVRLWDIRSGQQIQVFNGHTNTVSSVEYSPFIIKNNNIDSNVICSGSWDNTIRFWDIRSNKHQVYMIDGDEKDDGINCLKFIELKKRED
ncbi:G-protein beta WD-40 repeats containing protein [Reticulomyxa filosa]|uniref:G-protein beta WD-40 repeats containing protein n=1 Tax=Reticulomyxa filosa TaxID=46433 RepID=X6N2V6_RETFI|nr:G-protein beta WD-40 repeats containing protein [Reticulomyxa filosa]|eukprot:ETO20610.1 G-protein beta WD-40 repeats containing protein [Reticulomyxa filosa]